jgi:hypothetical protein
MNVEREEESYLTNGFPVGDGVDSAGSLVAGFEGVADERWAERLDHEVVVVESGNDDGGIDTVEGSGDLGSRHIV